MDTITIELKNKTQNLMKGKNYLVNHTGSKQKTRRIFKGIEKGILDIPFLVFTTKVNKEASATIIDNGETITTRYHNLKHSSIPNEILIPYYDVLTIND
jgi:hypothetical protein